MMSKLEMCYVPAHVVRKLLYWADAGWDSKWGHVDPDEEEKYKAARRKAKAILTRAAERED